MSIRYILDCREKALVDLLPAFEVEQLIVGDIHIYKGDAPKLIIERKTYNDLYMSIIDGRYREQRSRMIQVASDNEDLRIMYIFEKQDIQSERIMKIINGAITNLEKLHFIHYEIVDNVQDTAKRIVELGELYVNCDGHLDLKKPNNESTAPASETLRIKKKGVLPTTFLYNQLRLIPTVGEKQAALISDFYKGDLRSFYTDIWQNNADNILNIKGVGKAVSQKILTFCLYKNE